jgi:hypothetical protein
MQKALGAAIALGIRQKFIAFIASELAEDSTRFRINDPTGGSITLQGTGLIKG